MENAANKSQIDMKDIAATSSQKAGPLKLLKKFLSNPIILVERRTLTTNGR